MIELTTGLGVHALIVKATKTSLIQDFLFDNTLVDVQFSSCLRAIAATFRSASDRRLGGCGPALGSDRGMAGWAAALAVAVLAAFLALIPAKVALAWASSSAVTVPAGLPSRSSRQAPLRVLPR